MLGEVVANRYELERVLGTGGAATVFCAFDSVLERKVALKVLHDQHSSDDDYVARFENEARAAARLTHPNIVTVIDRGEQDGRRFIVFEHVEGMTLKELAAQQASLPIDQVLRIGGDVALGLAFAHANGIVHRDVKPQNVLVDGEGRAKVTDFGIARTGTASGHTEAGTILGTGSYISPEQARGERAGPESDVYALGAVLYELLTGRPPYDGPSFVSVAMRHVRDPVPEVGIERPDSPQELAALVERCLAKEPTERPSAEDVARGLAAIARGATPNGAAPADERTFVISRRGPARRSRLAGRAIAVLAALMLVGAAAVAAVLFKSVGDGGPQGGPVAVEAVATYDPVGGDGENDAAIQNATDGDPNTYWSTEGYEDFESFGKEGVGLILDVGEPRELSALTVTTDLPGWTAEIRAGSSQVDFPPQATIAESREAGATTTWELGGDRSRYYLIWITRMAVDDDGRERAHINEVRAKA
jgi:eukaryotic-like serine/threonine-protein kinase